MKPAFINLNKYKTTMFNINSPGILDLTSAIAIVLYGENINDGVIEECLEKCREKFSMHKSLTYFYSIEGSSDWENLYLAALKKRKFEIDNKQEFHYVIAVNVKNIQLLELINVSNLICDEFSLYYFSGFFNNSSMKTCIKNEGFLCVSRIFDVAAKFFELKEKIQKLAGHDIVFGDRSIEHAFYYYLKTLNLKLYCANPSEFESITE